MINTTNVEARVLERFERYHKGLMMLTFYASWRDAANRAQKPDGALQKIAIKNSGPGVVPAVDYTTLARIAQVRCEQFAKKLRCRVDFRLVFNGRGPDPDIEGADEDDEDPWRHQVNVRVDASSAVEDHEVANEPVADTERAHDITNLQPPATEPTTIDPTITASVDGVLMRPSPSADVMNAFTRLEAKIDNQPQGLLAEARAVIQQQRLERSAEVTDLSNVLRNSIEGLVRLEERKFASLESLLTRVIDGIVKGTDAASSQSQYLIGQLVDLVSSAERKVDAANKQTIEAYKELGKAQQSDSAITAKQGWSALREAMNERFEAVRAEVRAEFLEKELARRDALPPPTVAPAVSKASWYSPFFDKMIEAFPMLALVAGSRFAANGWGQGAEAAIGFFSKLTGQPMPDMSNGEIPEGEAAAEPPTEAPPSAQGPQYASHRGPGSNGAPQGPNGAPSSPASAQAPPTPDPSMQPEAPPSRPRRMGLLEHLTRLRQSLTTAQIAELQAVIPATAWTGFETACMAQTEPAAVAALLPLGVAAQQDRALEAQVRANLDTEQAKLFDRIVERLTAAVGLRRPEAPPTRPRAPSPG